VNQQYVKVARMDEIEQGRPFAVEIGLKSICLIKAGSSLYCLSDNCTHADCNLSEFGEVEDNEVECTCHGSRFDITTGEATQGPALLPLRRYPVEVRGDEIFVSTAESGEVAA
jgi:3-phenylpropionate/trans-cinnamate dioxygenase ferredoxin subunit